MEWPTATRRDVPRTCPPYVIVRHAGFPRASRQLFRVHVFSGFPSLPPPPLLLERKNDGVILRESSEQSGIRDNWLNTFSRGYSRLSLSQIVIALIVNASRAPERFIACRRCIKDRR